MDCATPKGTDLRLTHRGEFEVRLVTHNAPNEADALTHLAMAAQKLRPQINLSDWQALRDEGRSSYL